MDQTITQPDTISNNLLYFLNLKPWFSSIRINMIVCSHEWKPNSKLIKRNS